MLLEHKTNFRLSPSQPISQQNNVNVTVKNNHSNEMKQLKQTSKKEEKSAKQSAKPKKNDQELENITPKENGHSKKKENGVNGHSNNGKANGHKKATKKQQQAEDHE